MRRVMSIGIAAAAVATLMVSSALAQRDSGAKARGEIGTGFWHSTNRHVVSCPQRNVVTRATPRVEAPPAVASDQAQEKAAKEESQPKVATQQKQDNSYRRYSYEPSADTETRPARTYQRRTSSSRRSVSQPATPEDRLHPGSRKW